MSKVKAIMKKNYTENKVHYLSFAIPFLAMLVIFIGNSIYPFGERSFLHIDMYHQYFPFLVDFFHKIEAGESIYYSWNAGIGSNFVALLAYYLASPLNWLCLLIPEQFLMEFMSYLVVLKAGLCGLTASIYLSKHFQTKSLSVSLFATFYAMSGYMAAYNWNVMWLDCIVLAPLIVLGLEALVKEGKYKLYCVTLGLAILSNYYICIMICIYLVLYFAIVLWPFAEKKVKAFLNFAWASLLAGGLGALFLIPEVCALQLSRFSSASFPTTVKTYFSIFDIIARHFMDVTVETGLDHWPNIYCSVAVLFLVPIYLLSKNISVKKKFAHLFLVFLLIVSFSNNVLTFIWHGFNYPDSLPCRQSFLYILLILTISYEAFSHLRELSKQEYTYVFTGMAIFFVLSQKLITDDAITDTTLFLTVIFVISYAMLLYVYVTQELQKYLIWIAVFAVFVESGCNMILTSVPTVSRTAYLNNYETYHEMWEKQSAEDEGEFYRYDKKNRVTNNDSMLQNYPSASMFSSTTNGLVNNFYGRYGMRTSKVFYCTEGMTPLMSSLLSVGYTFGKDDLDASPLYETLQEQNGVYLYKNQYSVPLGFCIYPEDAMEFFLIEDEETAFRVIEEGKKDELLPLDNQNLLGLRLGAKEDTFNRIPCENEVNRAEIQVPEAGNIYAYMDKKLSEVKAYVNGEEVNTFKKLSNNYILDLGYQEAGTVIELTSDKDCELNASAYILNETVLASLVKKLNEDTMKIETMESDYIRASVSAKEEGYLILSMPYDPGFQVTVNGVETEVKLFEEMMMAIPLTEGDHRIEITYYPQGMTAGMVVWIVSIVIFGGIVAIEKKRRNRKNIGIEEII